MTDDAADTPDVAPALDGLEARGPRRADPVRWRLAEALSRRAVGHTGEARRLIEQRLAAVMAELEASLVEAEALRAAAAPEAASRRPTEPGPLAALVAHAKAHAKPQARPTARMPDADEPPPARAVKPATPRMTPARRPAPRAAPVPMTAPAVEPPGLHYFRRTWARLKADERLAQSRASLPPNAGPLNSHHLVHRALATLHELAPGYYEHFIEHVDDLLWIEAATGGAGTEAAVPSRAERAEAERKGRGR
jgi:hypothetical protein